MGDKNQDQQIKMISTHLFLLLVLPATLGVELPYMRLRDNLDEPSAFGFGLDLQGFGVNVRFTDMQAHSLKPSGGTDMQFNMTNNQIRGYGDGEGHCVAVRHLHVSLSLFCFFFVSSLFVLRSKSD